MRKKEEPMSEQRREEETLKSRLPYHAPVLIQYGPVTELTMGTGAEYKETAAAGSKNQAEITG
jgi:hypothetical protein